MQKRNATAAVIGAGDYIGAEIAKKFAGEGFTVFAGRRDGASSSRWFGKSKRRAGRSWPARSMRGRKKRSQPS
jgi:NAD(P)-dependent dehydrogenase (short-subunit alcohol dehydrogenase family)